MFEILLVEDDNNIREVIVDFFENKKDVEMHINEAANGDIALEMFYENEYDLVLLDIMLPGENGFELCKELRKKSDIPIIFITAKAMEEDILHGYDIGCDDYIVKPFLLPELYAKVKAFINRSKGLVLNRELIVGNIKLNQRTMTVTCEGKVIELAPKEYLLLKILMENKNAVVSRENLLIRVWGYDYDGNERVLDNHIKKLRKALGENGSYIKTVIRYGYKMIEKT